MIASTTVDTNIAPRSATTTATDTWKAALLEAGTESRSQYRKDLDTAKSAIWPYFATYLGMAEAESKSRNDYSGSFNTAMLALNQSEASLKHAKLLAQTAVQINEINICRNQITVMKTLMKNTMKPTLASRDPVKVKAAHDTIYREKGKFDVIMRRLLSQP
ncbi:MAG: hypothetical protein JWL62_752 [Hyphomicrobiales bacterium]|nr:hypothetical protein [Hyphomicrobiales bacterium]